MMSSGYCLLFVSVFVGYTFACFTACLFACSVLAYLLAWLVVWLSLFACYHFVVVAYCVKLRASEMLVC
jgi:hypothetical protein